MTRLEEVRRRAEQYLARDPRVGRWRIRTDGAIALEVVVQGAVPPQDRYQIVELLGRPLYRVDRPEGALDALLEDLVVVRVDVDGMRDEVLPEAPAETLERLDNQFWTDLWVAAGFLERGKLYQALKWICQLRETIFAVGRLAVGNPDLRDEEAIATAAQPGLALTCCPPEPKAIGQALLAAADVYLQTREPAAKRLGSTFPEEAERLLMASLEQHVGTPAVS